MGMGYCYKCKKCNHEYSVHPGIGMTFPTVYREILADISEGKYGSELQKVYQNTPYAAVNGEGVVYICSECGTWEVSTDVSLYAPDDKGHLLKKQYGDKTVEEWGHVPYVTPWELGQEYHIVKRHYHKCGKCGKRMHKASDEELNNLPCPVCGSANQAEDTLMWD